MLCFGVTRDFEDAKQRLENLAELVRQSGEQHLRCHVSIANSLLYCQLSSGTQASISASKLAASTVDSHNKDGAVWC